MRWQRVLRLILAVAAVAVVVSVVFAFKRRAPEPLAKAPVTTDPGAVVEVTGGRLGRFKFSRQDISVDCERQLVYADGSTKLVNVTIVSGERQGRVFTVKAREGKIGQNESSMVLTGDVRLTASDGLALHTEEATFSSADNMVHAVGAVEFSRGRTTGSGTGMTYDTNADILTIAERAELHVAGDGTGTGRIDVKAGSLSFARAEHRVRFEMDVTINRAGQIVNADSVLATLTEDEKQIDHMELRGRSQIAMAKVAVGGLQRLNSRDMDLQYGPDGETLQHAVLLGDAAIFLAGERGTEGRQIMSKTMDITLAPDGGTPTALVAREAVQLVLPAERSLPMRTIRSASMRSDGEPGKGLTHAEFTGGAEYAERSAAVNRTATAAVLDVDLRPGMSGIDGATFTRGVCFIDGGSTPSGGRGAAPASGRDCPPGTGMAATAASARYDLDKGVLNLSGSEPGWVRPHVINDKISVDATTVDLTLSGPKLVAKGSVKSVLQGSKPGRGADPDRRVPSMLKEDKPVNVTADALDYDGSISKATYTGNAQLWQDETSIKGKTILLDEKTGDVSAAGGAATVTMREEPDKDKKMQRVRSVATSTDFHYEDATRKATYTGSAHMTSPSGDLAATKIELFLGETSDTLSRVEAYESVTLRDEGRVTTGTRLTYTTDDEKYVVSGAPVKVLDQCKRETTGKTLTYLKSTDTVTMDGNLQTRTQTTGNGSNSQCR